jgi:hypothetical protein
MSWAKLDDQFHSHRKAKRAWKEPRALGLHLLALSYCAGQLTDGLVDDEFVEEKVPNRRERDRSTHALVDAGLWTREDDGWRINDWLDYNPSREYVLDRRRKESERKAAARAAKAARAAAAAAASGGTAAGVPTGVRPDTTGTPPGSCAVSALPDPTRPDPTPTSTTAAAASASKAETTDPLTTVSDARLTATVEILRTCPQIRLDCELMGVIGALNAHPNDDHVKAAHRAIVIVNANRWTDADAGRVLWMAFKDVAVKPDGRHLSPPRVARSRLSEREERQNRRRETAMRLAAEQPQEGEAA